MLLHIRSLGNINKSHRGWEGKKNRTPLCKSIQIFGGGPRHIL